MVVTELPGGVLGSVVQTREEIVQIIQEYREQVQALGVRRLGLFGSFARREVRPESDVDLWVEFEPGRKTFDNFMELAFLLVTTTLSILILKLERFSATRSWRNK
jgi:predicted nucleotidyltransferase